ncbi:MAG TPA: HAD family hydrolase [Tepidisphaeraceae bacterium]|jgi:phosphoglycolate phosphatase|nr:HAD family hydrolase [Tepidisphaeraceae bacterium]
MPPKAILFDLDGTLLDSLADIADSCNAALSHHSFPTHPTESYKFFVGDGVATLLERTLPTSHNNLATIAEVSLTYRSEYQKRWNQKTRPYPGVAELLDTLIERRFKLAVLSNKPDDFTRQCVTNLLADWRFDIVMGSVPTLPHKPHPAGALQLARTLNLPPADFVYLGDTSTDMQTAVGAKMLPVGVLWGFRPEAELLAYGAKHLLKHPLDLLPLLDRV